MNTEILQQLMTESEIKVYFALLELESSTVGPLIKRSKVPDSKIYIILEKLKEKGLVSFVIKNNVKHFQASDPKNIIRILNEKKQDIIKLKKELRETIIPQIEKRKKLTEDKQEAVVYESYEGLKSAFNIILETMKKGEEYRVFVFNPNLEEERVIRFLKNYHKKRAERGIKIRLIAHKDTKSIIKKLHKYPGMRFRYSNLKLPVGIFIFKGHVMTVLWTEKPTAFVIKSRKNYDYYREFFDEIWKTAML